MQPLLSFRGVLCLKSLILYPFLLFFLINSVSFFFSRTGLGTEYSIYPFKKYQNQKILLLSLCQLFIVLKNALCHFFILLNRT